MYGITLQYIRYMFPRTMYKNVQKTNISALDFLVVVLKRMSYRENLKGFTWLEYCRHGIKFKSINQSWSKVRNIKITFTLYMKKQLQQITKSTSYVVRKLTLNSLKILKNSCFRIVRIKRQQSLFLGPCMANAIDNQEWRAVIGQIVMIVLDIISALETRSKFEI